MSSVSLPVGGASAERWKSSPSCRQGGASAELAMSSASLLAGRGLGGAGGVLCLVVGAVGPRRSRASSTPAERGLVGAGIVLCLVLGLTKQRLARFIALFASLFVGIRSLRHPHAVPPTLEAALAGGAVRVEQRPLLRPLRGDLLLRLQVLLEEMVVVGGVGLHLPELHLPHPVHILGTGLADGHGAMHRRGWRGGGGWRRIIDYHVLH